MFSELREKVKQLETKSQRLVECFRKTSQSFRQAVYLLFGFKTDALSDNNFRLTSMFAEREDDNLLFKVPISPDSYGKSRDIEWSLLLMNWLITCVIMVLFIFTRHLEKKIFLFYNFCMYLLSMLITVIFLARRERNYFICSIIR